MNTLTNVINVVLDGVERFLTTWRFPSFMLMTLGLLWVFIVIMAFMPVSDGVWGAFAEDFKVWCFGYDPETGSMKWIYLVAFTVNPLILSLVIGFVWYEQLARVLAHPALVKPYAISAVVLVVSVSVAFPLMYSSFEEQDFEFRPEDMRTSYKAPAFRLINGREEPVSLDDYGGKVVMLTSIYSTCGDTCPMIMNQAKKVLDGLTYEERQEIILLAITMDPERDTPEMLNRMAEAYRLEEYNYELLTGDPEPVHRLLDRIGIRRMPDEETGEISHVNLFLMIDREGRIAFRFTLGDTQQEWMTQAVKKLINEPAPAEVAEANE